MTHLPVWDEHTGTYLDPDTGEVLPTWDQALDAIGEQDEPRHVARFGARFDAQGVLAGSRDASRCIGYLTKYLTKHLGDCHQAATDAQADHAERLADALRYEPCSPTCANWLRYGIQPRTPGLACGQGPARARPTAASTSATPGAASWSPASGPARPWPTTVPTGGPGSPARSGFRQPTRARYSWEPVKPGDPDHMPNGQRLLHVVADRIQWQTALDLARRRAARGRSSGNRAGRMTSRRDQAASTLLTVEAAAERLSTSPRFIRRLIAERRIEFVKVGRHVRISESALKDFIDAGRVEPLANAHTRHKMRGVA